MKTVLNYFVALEAGKTYDADDDGNVKPRPTDLYTESLGKININPFDLIAFMTEHNLTGQTSANGRYCLIGNQQIADFFAYCIEKKVSSTTLMILILDDHPVARQGLASIIQMYRPEETIAQAGNVGEAIEQMHKAKMNMVFVDVNLGKESGFTFVEWIKRENCDTKIFFITSSSRQSDFLYAETIGADAYVLKDAFIDDIMYGLKVVERGGKFYSPMLIDKINRPSADEQRLHDSDGRGTSAATVLSARCRSTSSGWHFLHMRYGAALSR